MYWQKVENGGLWWIVGPGIVRSSANANNYKKFEIAPRKMNTFALKHMIGLIDCLHRPPPWFNGLDHHISHKQIASQQWFCRAFGRVWLCIHLSITSMICLACKCFDTTDTTTNSLASKVRNKCSLLCCGEALFTAFIFSRVHHLHHIQRQARHCWSAVQWRTNCSFSCRPD